MRIVADAGTLLMRGRAHWTRCGFEHVALIDDLVMLEPLKPQESAAVDGPGGFAGLAFDRHCRLFHPLPEEGKIEYLLWGQNDDVRIATDVAQPYEVSGAESETGDFGADAPLPKSPIALACDEAGYLYVADRGGGTDAPALWLIDIWQHEVAKRIPLPAVPLDLAHANGRVYVLLEATGGLPQEWMSVSPCDALQALPWPVGPEGGERLDVVVEGGAERGFVLVGAGTAGAYVACIGNPHVRFDVAFCSDFVIGPRDPEHGLLFVFARRPGEDFVQFRLEGKSESELLGLQAPGYDGRGIALAPDGRSVVYWTARGLRRVAPARTRYVENGTVFGFALDSNRDQNVWGRMVLEACIPDGTRIEVRCFTRDDLEYGDALPRTLPSNEPKPIPIERPESTPLPSQLAWDYRGDAQPLFRDTSAPPLAAALESGFQRYEAPVIAPPGRFLWLVFELTGTRSKTPRLRSVHVEYPQHDLLRQLPKTLWRDPHAREFLGRYLMPLAAALAEWGDAAEQRHRLLDPRIARAGALEWIGALVGLAMDPCWPERARREMLAEASALFRIRGTVEGLRRMIEILAGGKAIIVEKFKLRAGGVVGNAQATISRSVVGTGFRVGGNIGTEGNTALTVPAAEAFNDYAHRFSVTVVAQLSEAQLRCVQRLIETHKPAHTMFDVCTVDTGTRVGVGLHVGLASVIGKGSAFDPLVLGDAVLGKGYLLGRPELDRPGARPPADRMRRCAEEGAP